MVTDPLSEILDGVRLRSLVMERSHLTAPWGIRVPIDARGHLDLPADRRPRNPPPAPGGSFHAVVEGQCWFELDGADEPIPLGPGDFLVLTQRRSHQIRDALSTPVRPIWELRPPPAPVPAFRGGIEPQRRLHPPPALRIDGGGAKTSLLSGLFFFDSAAQENRLLAALPPVMVVRAHDVWAAAWLGDVLSALECETRDGRPGTVAVMSHLAHTLFDHAVRAYVCALPVGGDTWLKALVDDEIGPALAVIHSRPETPWTVQSIAEHVAMSRSAFAERFSTVVGEPPLTYLTRFRLRKSAALLATGRLAVKEVASRVGYESLAAFSNAFKREHGVSPSVYRKRTELPAVIAAS